MIYSDVLKIFLLRNKTSDGIRIKNDNISQQFVKKQEPERDRTTASKFPSNCFLIEYSWLLLESNSEG